MRLKTKLVLTLHANPRHCEVRHRTPTASEHQEDNLIDATCSLSLPQQDDCKTAKQGPNTNRHKQWE